MNRDRKLNGPLLVIAVVALSIEAAAVAVLVAVIAYLNGWRP